MILEREQINRYLRHIIMPEISGPGQKKLLESSVYICGENTKDSAPAILYLAASGVGCIYCHFDDIQGIDQLRSDVKDLNGDISIKLIKEKPEDINIDIRIVLGSKSFTINTLMGCNGFDWEMAFVPTIVSIYNGWQGAMKVFRNKEDMDSFESIIKSCDASTCDFSGNQDVTFDVLSSCFSGALLSLEVIKLILGLGETPEEFLCFDLLNTDFKLIEKAHYSLVLTNPDRQEDYPAISDKKVLIVGTGGLGSPAAYALALSGIGTIGLVDYDVVEISNLNRQILHSTSRIGKYKAESAEIYLKRIRPDLKVNIYNTD